MGEVRIFLAGTLLFVSMFLVGCATPSQQQSRAPDRRVDDLLEVVTIVDANGKQAAAVLNRSDIVAALGSEPASWNDVALSRERLVESLRRTRYGTREQPGRADYAELFISGCLIHKRYSLGDLRVQDARELLNRYFDKRGELGDEWWIRKIASRTEAVEENSLIALLKSLGFEATRAAIAPVLFVRPPPDLR